ncbi:MAG: hypothetical protein LBB21_01235 [Holosporaceae bacterium]|jgi:hypothetical protein|nr:hypothetical protein [Holosporaceae bacterium]
MKKKIAVNALLVCGLSLCNFCEVHSLNLDANRLRNANANQLREAIDILIPQMQIRGLDCGGLNEILRQTIQRFGISNARNSVVDALGLVERTPVQLPPVVAAAAPVVAAVAPVVAAVAAAPVAPVRRGAPVVAPAPVAPAQVLLQPDRVETSVMTAVSLLNELKRMEFASREDEAFVRLSSIAYPHGVPNGLDGRRFLLSIISIIHTDVPSLSIVVFDMIRAFTDLVVWNKIPGENRNSECIAEIITGLTRAIQVDLPNAHLGISNFAISGIYSARGSSFYGFVVDKALERGGDFPANVLSVAKSYGETFCTKLAQLAPEDRQILDSSFDDSFGDFYFRKMGERLSDNLRNLLLQFSLGPIINVCALRDFLYHSDMSLRFFDDSLNDYSGTIESIFEFNLMSERSESSPSFAPKVVVSPQEYNNFYSSLERWGDGVKAALKKRNDLVEVVSQFLLSGVHFDIIRRAFINICENFDDWGFLELDQPLFFAHNMFIRDERFFHDGPLESVTCCNTGDLFTCCDIGEPSDNTMFSCIFAIDGSRLTPDVLAGLAFRYSQYAYEALAISPFLRTVLLLQLRKEAREKILGFCTISYQIEATLPDIERCTIFETDPFTAFKTALPNTRISFFEENTFQGKFYYLPSTEFSILWKKALLFVLTGSTILDERILDERQFSNTLRTQLRTELSNISGTPLGEFISQITDTVHTQEGGSMMLAKFVTTAGSEALNEVERKLCTGPMSQIGSGDVAYYKPVTVELLNHVLNYIWKQMQPEALGDKMNRRMFVARLAGVIAQGLNHCVAGIAESSSIAYSMFLDTIVDKKFDVFVYKTVRSAFNKVFRFFVGRDRGREYTEYVESTMCFDCMLAVNGGKYGMPQSAIIGTQYTPEDWIRGRMLYDYLSNTTDSFAAGIKEQLMYMRVLDALSGGTYGQVCEVYRTIISLIMSPKNFVPFMVSCSGFRDIVKQYLVNAGVNLPHDFNSIVHPDDFDEINLMPNGSEKNDAIKTSHAKFMQLIALDMLARGGYTSLVQ